MPTQLDRIQCLLQPDSYASVKTLAKHNRRALSAMCAELIDEALRLPKYKQQIEEAVVQVAPKEDPRPYVPQVRLTALPTTKPRLDHKGYLMRDGYGNVLLEDESPAAKPASQQWKEDYEEMKAQTSDDVDARLKKMEEMMAQMAAMMQAKA